MEGGAHRDVGSVVASIVLGIGCSGRHFCSGEPAVCDRNPPSAARRRGPRRTLDRQPDQRYRGVPLRARRLTGNNRSLSNRSAPWRRPAILGSCNTATRRDGNPVRDRWRARYHCERLEHRCRQRCDVQLLRLRLQGRGSHRTELRALGGLEHGELALTGRGRDRWLRRRPCGASVGSPSLPFRSIPPGAPPSSAASTCPTCTSRCCSCREPATRWPSSTSSRR